MKRLHKIRPNKLFYALLTVVILCTVTWKSAASGTGTARFYSPLTVQQQDTNKFRQLNQQLPQGPIDTTKNKRVTSDTFALKFSKDSLEAPITYQAEDSAVILIAEKKVILYGKTKIDYQNNTLTAPKVELDQATQILTAVYATDSAGLVLERAQFTDGKQKFQSDTIRFNMKNKKGITTNTYTQQEELYIKIKTAKMIGDVTYGKDAWFTTCNLDEPHFAFVTNKIKIINKKLAISGPTHPEFEGVPVPIILPFGFFPLSQGRHSGLLPPRLANNEQQGIGLEGLGYYKVISDYWDVKAYGNIYSYGGWAWHINPTYRKRYHYDGALDISEINTKIAFKGDPDYTNQKAYNLSWSHRADSRARPGVTFSASVNAGSTQYNRLLTNNAVRNFENQASSSISYSKVWKDKPFSLSLSASHSQNATTRLISVNLPDGNFAVNTIYPFQRQNDAGGDKWYDKLGIGYNATFRNGVSFYDSAFSFRQLLDTMQWGAAHTVPIQLTLPPILNGAVIVSPSVSYSQQWISQKMNRKWNSALQKVDTLASQKGFFVAQDVQFGLSFSTAVYGMYTFKSKKILGIRHTVRPTFSMNYRPNMAKGYYQIDTVYAGRVEALNQYTGSIYQGYSYGRTGGMSFTLDNSLDMKVRSKDTTGEQKDRIVPLIERFGISTSYNFLADSFRLAPIAFNLSTTLFKKINISASASLDPYQADSLGKTISRYAWQDGKFKPGHFTNASVTIGASLQSKAKDPEKEKQKQEAISERLASPALQQEQQRLLDYAQANPAEFVDFNIPWNLNFSYSFTYYSTLRTDYKGYVKNISSSLNLSGGFNLTPKWNFSAQSNFDFKTKEIQYLTMSLARDMHCWQMGINVAPIGRFRYFNITINPKSALLQDLKINRSRSFINY